MSELQKSTREYRYLYIALALCFLVVIIAVLMKWNYDKSLIGLTSDEYKDKAAILGQQGDYFGGMLNPWIGIATLIMLVINAIFQLKQIQEARSEALSSSDATKEQARLMAIQSFEQSFFSWLQNYRSVLESVTDQIPGETIHGSYALTSKLSKNSFFSKTQISSQSYSVDPKINAKIITYLSEGTILPEEFENIFRNYQFENWEDFYKRYEDSIDGIFRVLYRLIKWIDMQPSTLLSSSQKWEYVAIIRSQLSQSELILMLYNGLTPRGTNFRDLIEKYALFDNLKQFHPIINCLKETGLLDRTTYKQSAFNSVYAWNAQEEKP